jgi:hypothetical protein
LHITLPTILTSGVILLATSSIAIPLGHPTLDTARNHNLTESAVLHNITDNSTTTLALNATTSLTDIHNSTIYEPDAKDCEAKASAHLKKKPEEMYENGFWKGYCKWMGYDC